MLSQILMILTVMLSVIGLAAVLFAVSELLAKKPNNIPCELVIFAGNCEDDIEYAVRNAAAKTAFLGSGLSIGQISVLDCTSADSDRENDTKKILTMLEDDIDLLKVYTPDSYKEHIRKYKPYVNDIDF